MTADPASAPVAPAPGIPSPLSNAPLSNAPLGNAPLTLIQLGDASAAPLCDGDTCVIPTTD